jgi:hypothetical protein
MLNVKFVCTICDQQYDEFSKNESDEFVCNRCSSIGHHQQRVYGSHGMLIKEARSLLLQAQEDLDAAEKRYEIARLRLEYFESDKYEQNDLDYILVDLVKIEEMYGSDYVDSLEPEDYGYFDYPETM